MHNRHLLAPVRAGLVTGAATAGAIVGFGIGQGAPLGAFLRFGTALLGPLATRMLSEAAVLAGVVGHLAWMAVWGAGLFLVTRRYRPSVVLAVAVLMVTLVTWSSRTLLPAALGAVRYASLDGLQVALAAGVMALAMAGASAMVREG